MPSPSQGFSVSKGQVLIGAGDGAVGGAMPAGTSTQWPLAAGWLHIRQGSLQSTSQQTPSLQKLLWHSALAVHVMPSGRFSPPHRVLLQLSPVMQSDEPPHEARQLLPLHLYLPQLIEEPRPAVHIPAPSQIWPRKTSLP